MPLITAACNKILQDVLAEEGFAGVASLITDNSSISGHMVTKKLANDPRVELLSFTGSTPAGREMNTMVANRFGKTIMELGGNNSLIIMDDADIDMAVDASMFAAVGTAGQRCTSLRRLYVHDKVYDTVVDKLKKRYSGIKVGDPLKEGTLCGPLITQKAVKDFKNGIEDIRSHGGQVLVGGNDLPDLGGNFVEPTVILADHSAPFIQEELFAPVLYVLKISSVEEAIAKNNDVPQGLSSSLFTKNMESMFKWLGPSGSDCGLVNVNIGTSGAEIGGAFGGEKETGGGRESGSDAWKQYARRSTCTINYSSTLTLAQGVSFDTS